MLMYICETAITKEEFEEIEKALYKEGNRKVIATLEGD